MHRPRALLVALVALAPLAAGFVPAVAPGVMSAARAASPTALGAVATAEVSVVGTDGVPAGAKTLSLQTTRDGGDMYVVHRKMVKEARDVRRGTASTKTRAEVRGGGRKPYKQKGTGRARQGSTRSPLKVGGGVTFGPKPKNWANTKLNKKEAKLAVGIAIQNRAPSTVVVPALETSISEPKTKEAADLLTRLGCTDKAKNEYIKTLMVVKEDAESESLVKLRKATKNVPKLLLRAVGGGESLKPHHTPASTSMRKYFPSFKSE